MGGYGGSSGRKKDKCYYDTKGYKVKDKNAIYVAEYYIDQGQYVAFLHENPPHKRADLSVDGIHVEVKGVTTLNSQRIEKYIKEGCQQIHGDDYRYPPETHREGKLIIISRHGDNISAEKVFEIMSKGYKDALEKGYVDGKVEFWIGDKHCKMN